MTVLRHVLTWMLRNNRKHTMSFIIGGAVLVIGIAVCLFVAFYSEDEPDWHRSNLSKWKQYSGKEWE